MPPTTSVPINYAPPPGPRLVEMQYMVGSAGINTSHSFDLKQIMQSPTLSNGAGALSQLEKMLADMQQQQPQPVTAKSALTQDVYQPDTIEKPVLEKVVEEKPVLQKKPVPSKPVLLKEVPLKEAKAKKIKAKKIKPKKVPMKILNDKTGDPLIDGITGRLNNTLDTTVRSAVDIPKKMIQWGAGGFVLGELFQIGRSLQIKAKTNRWLSLRAKYPKLKMLGRFTLLPIGLGLLSSITGGVIAATKAAANLTGAALLNPTKR